MKCVLKKKVLVVLVLFLFLLVLGVGGYFWYQHHQEHLKEEKISEIKSHYGNFVKVQDNSPLSVKKEDSFEVVGEVLSSIVLSLEELNIQNDTDTKFQILGTNYYVDYQQVTPVEEHSISSLKEYYLPLEKKVTTKEDTNLYQDGVLKISIHESSSMDISYGFDSFYRVFYLGDYFDIKKEEVELADMESTTKDADYISAVQLAKYEENCNSSSCISKAKVEEVLKSWKDSGVYSISEQEYLLWLQGDLRLKPGAMLFTLASENETLEQLLQENHLEVIKNASLTFVNNDTTTKKDTKKESVNRYIVHQTMTEDNLKKVVDGVTIEKPKPKPVVTSGAKNPPSMDAVAKNIAVLNYHFFYDASLGESCNEGNCLEVKKFREQLDYLKNNHYKTLTMEEYRAWMYGEIELPARSVLLTIDDGAMGTGKHNGNKLIPILEEYQMHATLFLITGWWSIENYRSPYLDIESHTYDMHTEGLCKNQPRGAKLLCSSREQMLDDMRKSLSVTGSNKAFCFPFYAYNDVAIQGLKEVGFQLGFIGGYAKSNRSQDKYKITRYPVHSNTTLNQFINMIN